MTKTTKRAPAVKATVQADEIGVEIGVEELAEIEARRLAAKRRREAANEENRERQLKEIVAEENARNGRGHGITVRA
jgi:hypothetical protein